jgi:hypothetical protein
MKKPSISLKSSLINPHNSSVVGHRSSSYTEASVFFGGLYRQKVGEREVAEAL